MNTLNPAGTHVVDAQGKEWALDTAHPMPLPDGLDWKLILFWNSKFKEWHVLDYNSPDSHWIIISKPPAPKTQEEMDEEASQKWRKTVAGIVQFTDERAEAAWHAALAYARSTR